jgi:tripartite-type tricarboxylate transporter receptor subunit TctC
VAKLTLGISIALVAPAGSEITSWQALVDRAEQDGLRLSVPASHVAHDVARAMVERATRIAFEVVEAADDQASLADVARGRAYVGLVATNSLEAHSAAGAEFQPVVTFGARRSPLYPETPTFAEVTGDDDNDFTYSFALFGPPELHPGLARSLAEAIQTACARPAALTAAGAAGLPLACREAEVLEQTLERDLQVARRAYSDAR